MTYLEKQHAVYNTSKTQFPYERRRFDQLNREHAWDGALLLFPTGEIVIPMEPKLEERRTYHSLELAIMDEKELSKEFTVSVPSACRELDSRLEVDDIPKAWMSADSSGGGRTMQQFAVDLKKMRAYSLRRTPKKISGPGDRLKSVRAYWTYRDNEPFCATTRLTLPHLKKENPSETTYAKEILAIARAKYSMMKASNQQLPRYYSGGKLPYHELPAAASPAEVVKALNTHRLRRVAEEGLDFGRKALEVPYLEIS